MSETGLDAEQRAKAEAVREALVRAFVWDEAPPGYAYWREVYTNLGKLAAAPQPPTKAERLAEAVKERERADRLYLEARAHAERLYTLWIASVDRAKAIEAKP